MASRAHLADLPDALAGGKEDVLVVDCLMFGALAAAETARPPAAVLVHSAPGALAAPGGGMEGWLLAPVNDVRAAAGLGPVGSLWEAWDRFPTLCTTIPALDPLAERIPASFDYVGPVFERMPASGWRSPWPADDPRPLVLVSFSTGRAWDQASRIRRTVAALADRDCRVLVTTGQADVAGIAVPANAALVGQVPHGEVMPQATVVVTHAGHGTVTTALAHGVPLVCLPNPAADQPALAARVAALGAGMALDGERASAAEIGEAVNAVLANRMYGETAGKLSEAIAALPGGPTAASQLERLAADPPTIGGGTV